MISNAAFFRRFVGKLPWPAMGSHAFILSVLLFAFPLPVKGQALAPVRFTPFSQLAVYPKIEVLGRVFAQEETRLSAEIAGRITGPLPLEGHVIKKGETAIQLDPTHFELEHARAQAQTALLDERVTLAQIQWRQAQALAAKGFMSQEALEIRQTALAVHVREREAMEKGRQAAQLALSKTRITAPFDAIVMARHASSGDMAAPGTPLLTLASYLTLELRARVPQAYAELLDGALVEWQPDEGPSAEVRLVRLSPAIDTDTQTRLAVFTVPDATPLGRSGRLHWRHPVPHLPASYIQVRGGENGVYIQKEGQPAFVPLAHAQPGRPLPLRWPLDTLIADEGRLTLEANP
jgi:membrane fusion protein, multidrug efflux system